MDLTEELVDSLQSSSLEKLVGDAGEGETTSEGKESGEERSSSGDMFVVKQALTFIELIMSVKDSPEVSSSELSGVVFALRHLIQQSGWKPSSSNLPKGFVETVISLVNSNKSEKSSSTIGLMGGVPIDMLGLGGEQDMISTPEKPSSDAWYLLTHMIKSDDNLLVSEVFEGLLSYAATTQGVGAGVGSGEPPYPSFTWTMRSPSA